MSEQRAESERLDVDAVCERIVNTRGSGAWVAEDVALLKAEISRLRAAPEVAEPALDAILAAVDAEPELPDDTPEDAVFREKYLDVFAAIGREGQIFALRDLVRATKRNIRERIVRAALRSPRIEKAEPICANCGHPPHGPVCHARLCECTVEWNPSPRIEGDER